MPYNVGRRTILAKGLKTARQKAALSAKEASERLTAAGVNCTRGTLLAWERGGGRTSREPFASDLWLISHAYGIAVSELFVLGSELVDATASEANATGAPASDRDEPNPDDASLVV